MNFLTWLTKNSILFISWKMAKNVLQHLIFSIQLSKEKIGIINYLSLLIGEKKESCLLWRLNSLADLVGLFQQQVLTKVIMLLLQVKLVLIEFCFLRNNFLIALEIMIIMVAQEDFLLMPSNISMIMDIWLELIILTSQKRVSANTIRIS